MWIGIGVLVGIVVIFYVLLFTKEDGEERRWVALEIEVVIMTGYVEKQLGKRREDSESIWGNKKIGIIIVGILFVFMALLLLVNTSSAGFTVENLTIKPMEGENVTVGERFVVTGRVVNLKKTPENFQIELKIDGKKMSHKKVSMKAREMREIRFFYSREELEVGFHTIEVGSSVKELEVRKKEKRETELMDDFNDVSGNENYINPALDINVVSLKWVEDAGSIHGPSVNIEILETLKCAITVSPKINEDIGRLNPPAKTRYFYSLILDQDGDGEKDVKTGIIKKSHHDLDEHGLDQVDFIEDDNGLRKDQDYCKISWKGNTYIPWFYAHKIGEIKSFNWKVKVSCIKDNEVVASDFLPNEGWASFP